MKKIFLITAAALLTFTGCKDFLDIPIEGSLPSAGMDYERAENIFLPVSAAYASLRNNNAHSFPYTALEIASDNADKGSDPADNPEMLQIDQFGYGPSNGIINNLWVGYFDIVSAANYAIGEMDKFAEQLQNQENKDYALQCQGEARFIRAYAYFNLTRMFGALPKVDRSMTSEELASLVPVSQADIYKFIQKDLADAIGVLPEFYDKSYAGRVTVYSAMALKAKTHLYSGEMDDVVSLCDGIIASGRYDLLGSFREVFSIDGENGRESLFEIQSSTLGLSTGTDVPWMEYAYVQGPRGNSPGNMQGWGFCTPSQNLIDFYTARGETIRPATTLLYRGTTTPEGDLISENCTNPVYNGKVYTPSIYNNWSYNGYGFDHNVRILRYADVLLMFAEALERGGTGASESGMTAIQAVNKVRGRAGLDDLDALTLSAVLDERRAELAMEEDRFFDLVRTGEADSTLSALGFTENKNELFPIPAAQRQLNPNLGQNPGYGG